MNVSGRGWTAHTFFYSKHSWLQQTVEINHLLKLQFQEPGEYAGHARFIVKTAKLCSIMSAIVDRLSFPDHLTDHDVQLSDIYTCIDTQIWHQATAVHANATEGCLL